MASASKRSRTELFGRAVVLQQLHLADDSEERFEGISSGEESDLDHQLYDLDENLR